MARIPYFDTSLATGRAANAYSKLPALNISIKEVTPPATAALASV